MKIYACSLLAAVSLSLSSRAYAGKEIYVVTGPVVEVCCPENTANGARAQKLSNISVKKDNERLQIEILTKDMFDVEGHAPTRINAQPKVGDLVSFVCRASLFDFVGAHVTAPRNLIMYRHSLAHFQ